MLGQPIAKFISVEEYLEMEEQSRDKHEYYKGEVFAMAGASFIHNQITSNILMDIGQFLKDKTCRIYGSDLKIQVEANSLFTYPDLSIVCNGPQFWRDRKDTITNPSVIIEILSPDTMSYDRGDKFALYRAIPSLKEYLLISSTEVLLEQFTKQSLHEWLLTEYKSSEDAITIDTIGYHTSLKEFYRDVTFESA